VTRWGVVTPLFFFFFPSFPFRSVVRTGEDPPFLLTNSSSLFSACAAAVREEERGGSVVWCLRWWIPLSLVATGPLPAVTRAVTLSSPLFFSLLFPFFDAHGRVIELDDDEPVPQLFFFSFFFPLPFPTPLTPTRSKKRG